MHERIDVAVVGGGPAGLAAAALLARQGVDGTGRGSKVCVLERAHAVGGRAATHAHEGFAMNLGAHALYNHGPAQAVLDNLGVRYAGAPPPTRGLAVLGGKPYTLPTGPLSLLTTGLLGAGAKLEAAGLLASLGRIDTDALAGTTLRAWVDGVAKGTVHRRLLEAFFRVTSYANAPELASAGASIAQLAFGQKHNVLYLDGGWRTIVDGLAGAARAHGARVLTDAGIEAVEPADGGFVLRSAAGGAMEARAVILAVGPHAARSLVRGPAAATLAAWADAAVPARAACLDVALTRLPRPDVTFALGVDAPLYFSVHSTTAKVAPEGAALVHTMKYLAPDDAGDAEAELEAWMDALQPGWRAVLLHRRSLPAMIASNAIVRADRGGLAGRPGPAVPGAQGLFVAGDWVGPEAMLLDAALASARRATLAVAPLLAERASKPPSHAASHAGL